MLDKPWEKYYQKLFFWNLCFLLLLLLLFSFFFLLSHTNVWSLSSENELLNALKSSLWKLIMNFCPLQIFIPIFCHIIPCLMLCDSRSKIIAVSKPDWICLSGKPAEKCFEQSNMLPSYPELQLFMDFLKLQFFRRLLLQPSCTSKLPDFWDTDLMFHIKHRCLDLCFMCVFDLHLSLPYL